MSEVKNFVFKVESLRQLPDPVHKDEVKRYFAICKTSNLPSDFPLETNPRKQNLDTNVAKKIMKSYCGEDLNEMFHILNRGLLLSAKEVEFDNSTGYLSIQMKDEEVHGLVDGGHTYRIVTENLNKLEGSQYITLEIITGIEESFQRVAGARNTSVQVKEKSLAELEEKLDTIKRIVANKPFANEIAYMENDDKDIEVEEIIAILTIFHNSLHADQPVYCYSSKSSALKKYLSEEEKGSYNWLLPVADKIFALHDHIKLSMFSMYKKQGGLGKIKGGEDNANAKEKGKLGSLKEIGYKDGKKKWALYFSPRVNGDYKKIEYNIPSGFVYPILGAMRFLIEYSKDKGSYQWKTDPIEFYDKQVGGKLVASTFAASSELGRNPMAVGKSARHWESLYNYVAATFLQQLS